MGKILPSCHLDKPVSGNGKYSRPVFSIILEPVTEEYSCSVSVISMSRRRREISWKKIHLHDRQLRRGFPEVEMMSQRP